MKRQKKSLFLTLIILATALVAIVFGGQIWKTYQEESMKESTLLGELQDIEAKLADSQAVKTAAEAMKDTAILTKYYDTNSKTQQDKFREDVFFKFLYDSAQKMLDATIKDIPQNSEKAVGDFISSLVFTPGVRNEYGFREGKADITFTFSQEQELVTYLKILLETPEYEIFIHDFSYPEFGLKTKEDLRVVIPLKIWYQ